MVQSVSCLQALWRDRQTPAPYHKYHNTSRQVGRIKMHLNWWLNKSNLFKGRSIVQKQVQVTVTTDASKTGYGGHMNSKRVQGEWSEEQKGWHINLLEMEAVYLIVKHFLRSLQGQSLDQKRQHNRGTIRKQRGRYQVPSAMLQIVGSVEPVMRFPAEGFDLSVIILASFLVFPMLGCRSLFVTVLSNISCFCQVECTFSNISTC